MCEDTTKETVSSTVTLLCTRVQNPKEDDWKKLIRLLEYANGTRDDVLTLTCDDLQVLKWYVDASFAVHPDFKSHTGACMTYGTGTPITMSRKQKLNTRSSTEAELVGVDDAVNMILWTKLFLEAQGYKISTNVLYQDNKSAILLEKNGKRSSSVQAKGHVLSTSVTSSLRIKLRRATSPLSTAPLVRWSLTL